MFLKARAGLLASILSLVAACGGGGGGSSGGSSPPPPTGGFSPPPSPTAEDNTSANASKLRVALRADTRELTITWTDTFEAESTYAVEGRASGGTWQTLETLANSPGTGNSYQWQRVVDTSRTYRVTAAKTGYAVPLATEQGQTEIPVTLLTAPMSIEIDQTEPLTGTVQLSLANAVADAHTVSWLVDPDFDYLGSSNARPDFPLAWDTGDVIDGPHTLTAMVYLTGGAFIYVPRTVMIDNPGLRASLTVSRGGNWTPNLIVQTQVTSEFPVQQVEFLVNDTSLHIATTPDYSTPMGPVFEYEQLHESTLASGSNIFKVIATDINGATAEATREWIVDRAPTITLTSPADGAIVTGTLPIQGSFADDLTTATLRVSFGDGLILESSTPGPFSINHSLAGLPPGEYTLSFGAQDDANHSNVVTRRIIVPPSTLTYELVASEVAELLAVDQGSTLYKKTNGSVVVRSAAGVETTLQIPAGLTDLRMWYLSGGYVVMQARNASAPNTPVLYAFGPSGQATTISAPGWNGTPVVKGAWVAWAVPDATPHYQLYNLVTGTSTSVGLPSGTTWWDSGHDLVTTPGAEQLLFTAGTGGTPGSPIHDVLRYNIQTQTTDVLTGGDSSYHRLRTDNIRIASLKGSTFNQYELVTAPVSNPAAISTLASPVGDFSLRDGMIAWLVGTHLWAHDGTTTRDLAAENANLISVGDGRVLFSENGHLTLSPTTGSKQILLYSVPVRALHDDDSAFITTGASGSMLLYRLALP